MGDAAAGVTLQYLIAQPDVALQFGALPVGLDRLMSLLTGKRGIAIAAIRRKQRCQQMFVTGFPGAFVCFHEAVDIHDSSSLMSSP